MLQDRLELRAGVSMPRGVPGVGRLIGAVVSVALLLPVPAYAALTFLSWDPITSPSGLAAWSSSGTTGGSTSVLTITPQSGSLAAAQTNRDFVVTGTVQGSGGIFGLFADTLQANPINLDGLKINAGTVDVLITVTGTTTALYNQQFSGPQTLPSGQSGPKVSPFGILGYVTRTITVRFRFNPYSQATSWTALGPITITFGE